MSDLRDLIARLEAADGPDRELDALIWAELDNRDVRIAESNLVLAKSRVGPTHDECVIGWIDPSKRSRNFIMHRSIDRPQHRYTESVDAALSFVPEGLCWRYDSALGWAELFDIGKSPMFVAGSGDEPCELFRPPALALCIANARAMEAMEKD